MTQYIYFVKCPNCEDEPFDFFNDAKEYALGCLSQKPVITQIEVNRNDFGECTDSCDLGTIWSWEDMMKETDDEPAISIFTKDDLVGDYDADNDPEFAALDNSLDDVPDNFRKPIPDGMTIEELVEEMEENEDTVECSWCEELFDKSECRREVDLGWLCSRCEAAIKSRGEPLTFRENSYWDFLDEDISSEDVHSQKTYSWPYKTFELEYKDLEVTRLRADPNYRPSQSYDDYEPAPDPEEFTDKVDHVYILEGDLAADTIQDFLTEEDAVGVPGGLDAIFADDTSFDDFMESNLDKLVDKYYPQLLASFKDLAIEDFEDHDGYVYDDYEPDPDDYRDMLYDRDRF